MVRSIGFIGAGAMGGALIAGVISSGLVSPDKIIVYDVRSERLDQLQNKYGLRGAPDGKQVLQEADIIILAVKPQVMAEAVKGLVFRSSHLVISVAAGITLRQLEKWIGAGVPIIRAVPNTPALVGEGLTALAGNLEVTVDQMEAALAIFRSVGQALVLPEEQLNAVTGLSGSGPAYGYLVIEALADGGVRCGLPRDVALRLAAQTLLGAARMVMVTGEHPAVLKNQVTSPGGTTIAGLEVLEQRAVRGALMEAVRVGTQRAKELSEEHTL
ncbi:MAG: pyrroline-5-carboxylate reductase [Moorellaceae bacterium]